MGITATLKLDLAGLGTFPTDISEYLIEASIRQGRSKSLDPMNHGVATIQLDNSDGRFSVKNTGSPYYPDFREGDCGIKLRAGADQRSFSGYITRIEQDPYISSQVVVLTCEDRLARAARQLFKARRYRQQSAYLVLNHLLDQLERGEEVANPGGEDSDGDGTGSTAGWAAAAAGVSFSAPSTWPFKGDYSVEAICDGSVSGQGLRYDMGSVASSYKRIALFACTAPGDGNATLTIRGLDASLAQVWTTSMSAVEGAWSYWRDSAGLGRASHRYIEIITQSAVPLTLYVDGLHQVPISYQILRDVSSNFDALVDLVAFYDAEGGDALERLLATEAAGFAWMRTYSTLYGYVYARCQADRDAATTPVATFADDGTGTCRYVGFRYSRDAEELISEVRVKSEGNYEDGAEETTVWSLSPVPLTIPASSTVKLRAPYSAPAKRCWLNVATANSGLWPMDGSDFAGLYRQGVSYPPASTYVGYTGMVGQIKGAAAYRKNRAYLREPDTAVIPDGDTVSNATLRLRITSKFTPVAWTLEVRQPAGSPYDWSPIDTGDWQATPGSDTLIGSVASTAFPNAGEWLEIPLLVANINKTGVTAFYLLSSRDRLDNTPTTAEYITFDEAEIVVEYSNVPAVTQIFRNYGAGADIELTAGAVDTVVPTVEVKGIPYTRGTEESVVTDEPTTSPDIPNPLEVDMPFQALRTPDMVAEAARLVTRYGDNPVDRCEIDLEELDAASLGQMQVREINDLVTLKNVQFAHSTKVNGNFFIEGMDWRVTDHGKVLRATFYLEQK